MKKVICLLMMMAFLSFADTDSTGLAIKDSILTLQTIKEVQESISDNLSDIKARIKNSKQYITYCRNKLVDIQLYAGTGGCRISEYSINRMKETVNELNRAYAELIKAQRTLEEKIMNSDVKIKRLMTEYDENQRVIENK